MAEGQRLVLSMGLTMGLALLVAALPAAAEDPAPVAPRHFISAPEDREPWPAIELLGRRVEAGVMTQLPLRLGESFGGMPVETPVSVIRGASSGPTLCLTAGVHGDEIVGIEIVRQIAAQLTPEILRGTLVAIPIVNPMGFRRSSRYLPDRRDLNRHFPGTPMGSAASRLAYRVFEGVIRQCHILVDFHSGSFHRANLPQVRADLRDPALRGFAQWFGARVIVHSEGRPGTLRRAAHEAGVGAILYESGEPMRFDADSVAAGTLGTLRLLQSLGMIDPTVPPSRQTEVFLGSHWLRGDEGGIFIGESGLGDRVEVGDLLGSVTDPFTNDRSEIRSPYRGRVIGRAFDQVVIPGFALFHIGTDRGEEPIEQAMDDAGNGGMGPEIDERPE